MWIDLINAARLSQPAARGKQRMGATGGIVAVAAVALRIAKIEGCTHLESREMLTVLAPK